MKKIYKTLSAGLILLSPFMGNSQIINTIAGIDTSGYSGNGGPAVAAELNHPGGVVADASGNIFIADQNNGSIREVNGSGIISTYAGIGVNGYSGDGGFATAAELYNPQQMWIDGSGNLFIADQENNRIRKVDAVSKMISTVAGNGTSGSGGDGGPATSAQLWLPVSISIYQGSMYIADWQNNKIRRVLPNGNIITFAGNGVAGYNGDGGAAPSAELNSPASACMDALGNVYISDCFNNVIRQVTGLGVISTYAGNGVAAYSGDGGPALSAELYYPFQAYLDPAGNMFIADFVNNAIRKIVTGTGIISTVAGTTDNGFSGDGGPATSAEINNPVSICSDASDNLYIADYNNNRVRKITGLYTEVKTLAVQSSEMNIYPNPANNVLTIQTSNEIKQVRIVDLFGRVVIDNTYTETNTNVTSNKQLDISHLDAGMYFVVVKEGEKQLTQKLIVSK